MNDLINSPTHYTHGGIETIDYIEAKLTHEEFIGFLKGNALKYISRSSLKHGDPTDDLSKAIWYLNKIITSS